MTDEELQPFRVRGRRNSLFMIVLGGAALYWLNHLVTTGQSVPWKLLAIVAIGVTFGVGGLIEPLIIYRHTPDGKRFPARAHWSMFLTLLVAVAVGYGVMQYYGLH